VDQDFFIIFASIINQLNKNIMANFKPEIRIITKETIRESYNSNKNRYQNIQYKTYRELKKNLKRHLEENYEDNVHVSRSRRGEWGEWFEIWTLRDGKPVIIKQGWM